MPPDDDVIYLDHNATTPVLPEVVDAVTDALREAWGNPSSAHVFGRRARDAVEGARAQVAALLNASPSEILFTSGGTEANNLAIRGVTAARPDRRHVVTSTIEHPATARPAALLESTGWRVTRVGVDGMGRCLEGDAEQAITASTALVSVMHSNNETGVIQPIAALAAIAHRHGATVHTDAAQSVGKVPVDVNALGVDLLSVAGHKLYAPKGVGALFVRTGTPLAPLLLGAGHERGLRPGTENVASVVGLGLACQLAARGLAAEATRVAALRDRLASALRAAVPGLVINGEGAPRLPNTLNACFPRVGGTALLAACPQLAASTGSACHDGQESASPVLRAMGVAEEIAVGAVRLTLGRGTTAEHVDRAAAKLSAAWKALTA
ncbi:MAG: cysteine desulfurase [Deltaproteobacteria bacterium]|nr:cysteine desulfurase [Deltaproteobacteria bacterium]